MTADPSELRESAAADPGSVGPEAAAVALEAHPEDAETVGACLVALGDGDGPLAENVTAVADLLDADETDVRRGAASALRACFRAHPEATPAVVSALADALSDEDAVVRGNAGAALREIARADPDAVVPVADALLSTLDPSQLDLLGVGLETVAAVVEADADAAGPLLGPLLDTLVRTGEADTDLAGVVEREDIPEGALDHQRQYETELRRRRSQTVSVVRLLLASRPALAGEETERFTAALTSSGLGADRATLAEALGVAAETDPDAVAPLAGSLAELLPEEDTAVAAAAAWALGILAEEEGERVADASVSRIESLTDLLGADARGARVASAGLLSYLADHRPEEVRAATDALVACLEDDDPNVRASAALALGHAGASEASERLRAVAENDPEERVRRTADAAVEQIVA